MVLLSPAISVWIQACRPDSVGFCFPMSLCGFSKIIPYYFVIGRHSFSDGRHQSAPAWLAASPPQAYPHGFSVELEPFAFDAVSHEVPVIRHRPPAFLLPFFSGCLMNQSAAPHVPRRWPWILFVVLLACLG